MARCQHKIKLELQTLKYSKMKNTKNEEQCAIHDISNSYCVRRHMFFAVTNPIMEENLTKEEAELLCKKLNDEELDDTYVHYEVHNCC